MFTVLIFSDGFACVDDDSIDVFLDRPKKTFGDSNGIFFTIGRPCVPCIADVGSIEAFLDQPKLNGGNSTGIFFPIEPSLIENSLVELGKTCFEVTEKSMHDSMYEIDNKIFCLIKYKKIS